MVTYRDYFFSQNPKGNRMITYRITLTSRETGQPFMHHSTYKYSEASQLVKQYTTLEGVAVEVDKVVEGEG